MLVISDVIIHRVAFHHNILCKAVNNLHLITNACIAFFVSAVNIGLMLIIVITVYFDNICLLKIVIIY